MALIPYNPAVYGFPQNTDPRFSDPNFDPSSVYEAPTGWVPWYYDNPGANPGEGQWTTYDPSTLSMSSGGFDITDPRSIARSLAPVVAGSLIGAGVGGTTSSQAVGNAALGRPVTENLGNAAAADLVGAGLVGGTVAAGGSASTPWTPSDVAENPVQLSGPPVDSGAATDAAFGGGGPTAISEPAGAGVLASDAGAVSGTGLTTPVAAGAGAAGAGAGAGTALSRVLGGNATPADWASVLGTVGATGLGIVGANQQANASNALANRLFEAGQASRDRFNASMTPGFDPTTIPGYSGALQTSADTILRRLSATGGNPYGNPGGLIEANKQIVAGTALPAVQAYQNLNAQAGGFGSLAAGAPGAGANAVQAGGNIYNAIGSGLQNLTNPQPNLGDILSQLGLGRGAVSAA